MCVSTCVCVCVCVKVFLNYTHANVELKIINQDTYLLFCTDMPLRYILFMQECVSTNTCTHHQQFLNAFHYSVTDKRISFLLEMFFMTVKPLLVSLSFILTTKQNSTGTVMSLRVGCH